MSQSQSQFQQGRDASQFQLRLPDDLKARIQEAADEAGRSLNTEIVRSLTETYQPAKLREGAAKTLLQRIDPDGTMTPAQIVEAAGKIILNDQAPKVTRNPDGSLTVTF